MPPVRTNGKASDAKKDGPRQPATLFIRNLHPATTTAQLDAHFAGIGPLRRAFVVTDRQTGESRRVAYVKYATPAHAAAACEALHHSTLAGRRIDVQPARSKRESHDRSGVAGAPPAHRRPPADEKTRALGAPPMRTVVLRRVDAAAPDEAAVLSALEKAGVREIAQRVVVAEAGAALRLTFSAWSVAGRAAAALHACAPYSACIDALAGSSRATVIVRNLPFSVDRVEIRAAFAAAAPVRDVRVAPRKAPLKERGGRGRKGRGKKGGDDAMDDGEDDGESAKADGDESGDEDVQGSDSDGDSDSDSDSDGETARVRATAAAEAAAAAAATAAEAAKTDVVECAGYAFVEFFLVADAKHAMQKLNGSKIGGRVVAVDLVVERAGYKERKARAAEAAEENAEAGDGGDDGEENGSDEEASNDEEKEDEDGAKDENDADDDDENKDDEKDEDDGTKATERNKQKPASSSPEELGRTVFVRNLLFESSADELRSAMHKAYGPVEKSLIVMHKVTRRPRGTAFVRFRSPAAAARAVAASGPEAGEESALVLDGRRLLLTLAVDRGSADKLRGTGQAETGDAAADKGTEKEKDPRNMHLALVGAVRRDSPQAAGMTEQDFVRREKAETEKQKKLSHNPNAFVSDVRLSVRNLPRDMDEKTFKQMFLVAARAGIAEKRERKREDAKKKGKKDKAGKSGQQGAADEEAHAGEDVSVTHCKIIRNDERNGRSKCFGFIQFARHDAAMHALQRLNNYAGAMDWVIGQKPRALRLNEQREQLLREMWGERRRMLVEFAVEDRRMVRRIEAIKMRGRQKSEDIKAVRASRDDPNGAGARVKKGRKRGRGRETGLGSAEGGDEPEVQSWKRRRSAETDDKAEGQTEGAGANKKATPKAKRNFVQKLRRQRRLAKKQQ